MTQPTFDFSTLFETYKTAMAPVFRAQQEGLKTLERLAHYQFAVAGDYLEWSLAQAKASVGPKSAADLIGQQTSLNVSLSDKLRARAEEFSKIATETQGRRDAVARRDQRQGCREGQESCLTFKFSALKRRATTVALFLQALARVPS